MLSTQKKHEIYKQKLDDWNIFVAAVKCWLFM